MEPYANPDDKRVLRSQGDYVCPKSELANFFPNYADLVQGVTDEPENLSIDTRIFIVDRPVSTRNLAIRSPPSAKKAKPPPAASSPLTRNGAPASSPIQTSRPEPKAFKRVDFSSCRRKAASIQGDPLGKEVFWKSHKRAERREKNLRNIEKERAMHEKADLERLLAELQGPDWIRTMGVSAITDTEKKRFEPKRALLVRGIQSLINKFAVWKEKEKEMKIKKPPTLNGAAESDEETTKGHKTPSEASVPDELLDASAARQLLLEAKRSKAEKVPKPLPKTPKPGLEAKPFTSFYNKPYLRQAAVGSQRRGRNSTAFGKPLPELPDQEEFALPGDYVSEEALVTHARKRRRMKRASKDGSSA